MIPINKVRDLISKHSLLEKELSSGEIDKTKYAEKSKDYSDLNEIIQEIKEVYAGDIAAAVGLKYTTTGDTLSNPDNINEFPAQS